MVSKDNIKIHIATPVKNSIDTAMKTIESVMSSTVDIGYDFTVYNDFSDEDTTSQLKAASCEYGFNLVNMSDITSHPSPNYLLILQIAQKKAVRENAHLIIVESDVIVKKDTFQKLFNEAEKLPKAGLIAAITTNERGEVNFPYEYASGFKSGVIPTKKRLSFCCTLLTNAFLSTYDFNQLNPKKSWYDVFISHKAVKLGFCNYLMTSNAVIHKPHSSRPWKKLKYTHPLKYYWQKYTKGLDRI